MSPGSPLAGASLEHCLRSIDAALKAGDGASAYALAEAGAARGFVHPHLLTLAAHARLAAGDGPTALDYAETARDLSPRHPDVLNVYGLALVAVGRAMEAVPVFDGALRQAPNVAVLRYNKAEALENVSRLAQARREYERALAIQPDFPQAHARIAYIAALVGDGPGARAHADKALRQNPREVSAAIALTLADLGDRKFEEARGRATMIAQDPATTPVNRSIAQGVIGDAEDGLGRRREAFAAYAASNATRRDRFKPVFEAPGQETADARADRLAAYFRQATADDWAVSANEPVSTPSTKSPLHTHVFLVGFPRSGTTLMEQALAAHSDIETMEERDCMARAFDDFIVKEDGLARLAGMRGRDLEPWRKAYWKFAADSGIAPARGVFIDKMPLNTVLLPLIAKLFPNAKILFALRDPRDVVLSCFRRRFGMSPQMYRFLTLEGAAGYYDQVMTLAGLYRPLLSQPVHTLKYEDLVTDFGDELRKVCAFLGLAWDSAMEGFAEAARSRAIDTPSAAQVARGLYTGGIGQWRAYREQMKPVLPRLAPWVAQYGYEEE